MHTPDYHKLVDACLVSVTAWLEPLPGISRSMQQGDYSGRRKLAAAQPMLRPLLSTWIQRIAKGRPDGRIESAELNALDPGLLRSGDDDLIVGHQGELPNDIATLQVGSPRAFRALPVAHPLAKKKGTTLAQCRDETCISYTPGTLENPLLDVTLETAPHS